MMTPTEYTGALMDLGQTRRGIFIEMKYLTPERSTLIYEVCTPHVPLLVLQYAPENDSTETDSTDTSRSCHPSEPHLTSQLINYSTFHPLQQVPLAEVITDFFDQLKSRTKGYASMSFTEIGFRTDNLVKLDIRINGEDAPPLATIVHRDKAHDIGKRVCDKLKELIPRQQFKVGTAKILNNYLSNQCFLAAHTSDHTHSYLPLTVSSSYHT